MSATLPDASSAALDAQALTHFHCDTTNLPWLIFRAAFRAEHLAGLPARARALLAALARTVDAARPCAAIFARRELLTGRAMQSMRTFYRSLDDLEHAGLIHRPPQHRGHGAGMFGRAYLHLSQGAAVLLGLQGLAGASTEPRTGPASPRLPSGHPAAASDTAAPPGVVSGRSHPETRSATRARTDGLNAPSATVAHGPVYDDLYPESLQKRQPGTLPPELQRLVALGFHRFLVFRLMREAREQGKRLSDVVEIVWPHLKAAHAPIAYLRRLLALPVDFAHQRLVQHNARQAAHLAEQQQQAIEHAVLGHAGQVWYDRDAGRRVEICPAGTSLTVFAAGEHRPRVSLHGWQEGFVRAVNSGALLPASPMLAQQFGRHLTGAPHAAGAGQGEDPPPALRERRVTSLSTTAGSRLHATQTLPVQQARMAPALTAGPAIAPLPRPVSVSPPLPALPEPDTSGAAPAKPTWQMSSAARDQLARMKHLLGARHGSPAPGTVSAA